MSDWKFDCKKVEERSAQILESGLWADYTFLIGHEKTRFRAHKLFLSMASPVFDCMLNGPLAEKNDFIEISDVRPDSFRALLQYIYTDRINVESYVGACDLYYGANKYLLPHLKSGCIDFLRINMTPQNVCQIFEFSRLYDEDALLNECIEMIMLKTKEVLTDPSLMDAKLSTVKQIFGFNILNIDSELDLYFAAVKYSTAHGNKQGSILSSSQNNIDSSSSDKIVCNETNNKTFRSLISDVKILTLTPQEFAENIALSPFLTKSESYDLLMNVASKNSGVPVPKGFNSSRTLRYEIEDNPECNLDLGLCKDKDRSETTFRFVVTNFYKKKFMSLPFFVRNLSWRIAVGSIESGDKDQKRIGVYLYCCWINKSTQWSCPVKAEISLVSNKSNAVNLKRSSINHTYTRKENNMGSQILLGTIMDPKNGYLKDDSITVQVHIVAEEPTNNNIEEN